MDIDSASESDHMLNATAPYEEPEALLPPETQVETNGRVKIHRKHRKITARGLRASHKTGSILKELKKSNETMTQKLQKMEKKFKIWKDVI